jgi:hypothetical protein
MIYWKKVLAKLVVYCPKDFYGDSLEAVLYHLYILRGISTRQIAELTEGEVSSGTLRAVMREMGFELRGRGGPNNTKVSVLTKEECETIPYGELAIEKGVSYSAIRKRCAKLIGKKGE